ncbi:endonuclease/exonuclease/phosphatase family protein [Sphingobacterium sp. Mn56C]|uniref:endonuclease/exonuclease/phosphatase family protein n=1 Tax=Sphingobacterium sp. Mn56C TaxID=3395261 RepID=UPI003BD2431C
MGNRLFFRNKLGYFSRTVFTANILAALALLLSYAASFIDPQQFWPIAFFGLAFLPILLINLGFIVYWFLRKKRYMLISLLCILAGWNLLSKHINFKNNNDKMVVKADTILRVMSFNVHLFEKYDNPKATFREETAELVNTVSPDIACFQEFYSRIRGSKQFVKHLLEEANFEDYYFEPASQNDYEGYGQAIFSKFPIINQGTILKNGYGINRIIFADIKREMDTIRIYNVHLRSFALQDEDKDFIQKTASAQQIKDERSTKRVGRKLKRAFTNRSEQAKSLRQHIEQCPYPYIVMGDFNDTPMSYSVNLVGKNMYNAFEEKGFGWGVTHFGMLPLFQIDYILCDRSIRVDNYGIIKERLSDHYPIWADLIH